jgi:DNA repair protein RecO (recombination protein O)
MHVRTRAIVFHTVPYSDSTLIARMYTEAFGIQAYLVSTSRSKKGKVKSNLLQPLTQVEIEVNHRENKSLQRISEISCKAAYQSLHTDMVKTSIALFLAEVLSKSVREEEANSDLYAFLSNSLFILDHAEDGTANFHLSFLMQLTKFLGFFPQTNTHGPRAIFDLRDGRFRTSPPDHPLWADADDSQVIDKLIEANYETMQGILLTGQRRRTMVNHLLRYYELHLQSMHDVKSHHVLEAVLS